MTNLERHRERWGAGCGSHICLTATRIVLVRGKIPCDCLMIGEAPGVSEDRIGTPFVGPAGKLLDKMIEEADPGDIRIGFTNLVGCIPLEKDGKKAVEPDEGCIRKCTPRLIELVQLANPKIIVLVGKLAWKHATAKIPWVVEGRYRFVEIIHPAAILRANVAQQGLLIQKTVANLTLAFLELIECL